MTYEEAKEEVAKKHGYELEAFSKQAVELYAKSKWDEALELAATRADVTMISVRDGNRHYVIDPDSILSLKDKFKP